MLKWAVNTPRLSYLTAEDSKANDEILQLQTLSALSPGKLNIPNEILSTQSQTPSIKRQRLKRKSSDVYLSRRLQNWLDKENQVTSTPLHSNSKSYKRNGPLRRLNSFKDLSNIAPYDNAVSNNPLNPILPQIKAPSQGFDSEMETNNNPVNYATTLPTLEVEYSPSGLVPGPILALRGLGIADTYFDKPRYLPYNRNEETQQTQAQPSISMANSTFQSQRNTRRSLNSVRDDTVSLSSSKMGDQTLERMIDAILESTRKEKKPTKFARQSSNQQGVMSPTYTAAEDPANDLSEFWIESQNGEALLQTMRKKRRSLPASMASSSIYSEREIRSPSRVTKRNIFYLRRQRAVRRKRKASKEGVKQHALQTAEPALSSKVAESSELSGKRIENSSPDSGHNSCSEPDENSITLESNCLPTVSSSENPNLALDSTKRRLSFSNHTSIV